MSYQHFKGAVKKKEQEEFTNTECPTKHAQTQLCVFFPTTEMKLLDLTASDSKEQPLIPVCLQWRGINCHKLFPLFFPHYFHTGSIFSQPEEQLQLLGAKADSRTANKGAGAQNLTENVLWLGQRWTCWFNLEQLHFPPAARQILTAEPLCIFNTKYMYLAALTTL